VARIPRKFFTTQQSVLPPPPARFDIKEDDIFRLQIFYFDISFWSFKQLTKFSIRDLQLRLDAGRDGEGVSCLHVLQHLVVGQALQYGAVILVIQHLVVGQALQ
jgi:hypothetical protein